MEYYIHSIDPIIFSFGPLAIRWYGLAYLLGFVFAWRYGMRVATKGFTPLTPDILDQFFLPAILGVIIGGRLGHCFFYYPAYYLSNPLDIFMVWQGGMSFHGGLLGVIFAALYHTHRHHLPLFALSDNLAITAPIGIAFGRIANFINAEHVGHISPVPWAVIFPNAGPDPRHPSQLYEAFLEGFLVFIIIFFLYKRFSALRNNGFLSGCFLCLYGIGRIIGEQFREPQILHPLFSDHFTYAVLLSSPMVILGLWLIYRARLKTDRLDKRI